MPSEWNTFVQAHAGQGKSPKELSKLYRANKPDKQRAKKPDWKQATDKFLRSLKRAQWNRANVFEYLARHLQQDDLEFMKTYAEMYLKDD